VTARFLIALYYYNICADKYSEVGLSTRGFEDFQFRGFRV
jgi:hypothetical protein